ncbi:hypothetical protein H7Q97_17455 [Ochrobactrum sp. CM-21-5]|nr:hypothetical protein [Ochrobactrum sp. CM-21-5]MBC2887170.1 hypothetical protein [Ochrobactrum sp. CM-21-5]
MRRDLPSPEFADTLALKALHREENAVLPLENANLKAENQKLRDETP